MKLALCLVLALASSALASPGHPWVGSDSAAPPPSTAPQAYFSMGIDAGVTTRTGGAFSMSLRPELLYAPSAVGAAFGVYAEAGRNARANFLGGGVSATGGVGWIAVPIVSVFTMTRRSV